MDIEVREAGRKDLDKIVRLNKSFVDHHRRIDEYYTNPNFKDEKASRRYLSSALKNKEIKIFIGEYNNKVVAYFIGRIIKIKSPLSPARIGKITEAYVDKRYRRLGVGEVMFYNLSGWFKKNKIRHVELLTDSRNKISIKVWEKFGFRERMKVMRLTV